MKIIIVGCGNVGRTLAEQLCKENHDITVIDNRGKMVESVANAYDVMGITGNGASHSVQVEAGVGSADLLVAVTGSDELNLLCCLIAKKAGGCNTIARVSNPVYSQEIGFIKEELGLSMIVNPQLASAREMARILKFPSALQVDTFVRSRVEIVNYKLEEGNPLCDMALKDISSKFKSDVIISVVERGDEMFTPGGDFVLRQKDIISVIGNGDNTAKFFKKMGAQTSAAKSVLIIGGGRTCIFLAKILIQMGVKVRIIENDLDQCEMLTEMLPKAMVIHGDATDKELLLEEGLESVDAVITNTNFDEENIMLSLYAKSVSNAKVITKVHRIAYDEIIDSLEVGSIVYPKHITASMIIKYVRAMKNGMGSNIETLHRLNDNKVEALEFRTHMDSPIVNIPLKDLKLRNDVIIGCISHRGTVEIPNGDSVIKPGDNVIIVTTSTGISDVKDILK